MKKEIFRTSRNRFFRFAAAGRKVVSILEHVVEDNGMRKTGRLVKVDPDTASRHTNLAGEHAEALKQSKCGRKINTSFIERQNGTDRNRCSRKVRKSYCFSKDWDVHGAATCLSMYRYNYCWAVRTLRRPDGQSGPAMSAKLTDHVWTIREWLTFSACQ